LDTREPDTRAPPELAVQALEPVHHPPGVRRPSIAHGVRRGDETVEDGHQAAAARGVERDRVQLAVGTTDALLPALADEAGVRLGDLGERAQELGAELGVDLVARRAAAAGLVE